MIPGVSSAIAGPALAGIPLTHRQLTQGFTVISGHAAPDDPASTLDWSALARANTTLVIMMGVATLGAIAAKLITEGLDAETPAMTVADAGLPSQLVVRGTLADIAERSHQAGIKPPAITVIGAVAGFTPTCVRSSSDADRVRSSDWKAADRRAAAPRIDARPERAARRSGRSPPAVHRGRARPAPGPPAG